MLVNQLKGTFQSNELVSILPVLVLYKMSLRESKTFCTLKSCAIATGVKLELLVYDNSADPEIPDDLTDDTFTIHYISNRSNPGVSTAYNHGALLAEQLDKKWLLLLDQDTEIPENFLSAFMEGYRQHENESLFSPVLKSGEQLLSPSLFLFYRGFAPGKVFMGVNKLKYRVPLNSGLIIKRELFVLAGGYNEKLPLDFSDFDFLRRCKPFCRTFVVFNACCMHSLSSSEIESVDKVLGRFVYYVDGAREYAQTIGQRFTLFGVLLLRTLQLTIRFKDAAFFSVFLKRYFSN
jgi:GT2 family glycosyltransferase